MTADHSLRTELITAVFVDFENLALGTEEDKKGRFDIELVLKRLLERGRIVFKRAYCDWTRYQNFMTEFHKQGFEMVDIPRSKISGKNSADIRMVVDALDLCYSKSHIDTFALITGDSDFSPLVSKLKENDKRVVGCGVRKSTSDLLANNCDEFIFYDDLIRVQKQTQQKQTQRKQVQAPDDKAHAPDGKKQEAFERVLATVASLESDYDPVWGSQVKQSVKRVYPGFNESYYGYRSFSELLEDTANAGLIAIELDAPSGNYRVRSA
ncbi:MAG TPA: NYN domain-containing protein [Gammaproteobacteria bacterium]|jgi:uncharacterized protein (TIGR00288 family)|nr:NYN domain-containing protein [Gammaproteobacteria bacterium]